MLKDILKDLRKQNELTQQQVADVLSIDRSTYAYYETGKTNPDVHQITQLALLFKVTPNTLLGYKERTPSLLAMRDSGPFPKKNQKAMSILELEAEEKEILYLYRLLDEESKKETVRKMKEKIKTGD